MRSGARGGVRMAREFGEFLAQLGVVPDLRLLVQQPFAHALGHLHLGIGVADVLVQRKIDLLLRGGELDVQDFIKVYHGLIRRRVVRPLSQMARLALPCGA